MEAARTVTRTADDRKGLRGAAVAAGINVLDLLLPGDGNRGSSLYNSTARTLAQALKDEPSSHVDGGCRCSESPPDGKDLRVTLKAAPQERLFVYDIHEAEHHGNRRLNPVEFHGAPRPGPTRMRAADGRVVRIRDSKDSEPALRTRATTSSASPAPDGKQVEPPPLEPLTRSRLAVPVPGAAGTRCPMTPASNPNPHSRQEARTGHALVSLRRRTQEQIRRRVHGTGLELALVAQATQRFGPPPTTPWVAAPPQPSPDAPLRPGPHRRLLQRALCAHRPWPWSASTRRRTWNGASAGGERPASSDWTRTGSGSSDHDWFALVPPRPRRKSGRPRVCPEPASNHAGSGTRSRGPLPEPPKRDFTSWLQATDHHAAPGHADRKALMSPGRKNTDQPKSARALARFIISTSAKVWTVMPGDAPAFTNRAGTPWHRTAGIPGTIPAQGRLAEARSIEIGRQTGYLWNPEPGISATRIATSCCHGVPIGWNLCGSS